MINYLKRDCFGGQLAPPKETGKSPIFRAKIRVGDESVRCYVKPVPDQIQCPTTRSEVPNRELAGEALGYVLAKSVGLQTPDIAGVILLDAAQIPAALLPALQQAGNGKSQEDYLCWFSKDMAYPSLRHHVDESQPEPLMRRRLGSLAQTLAKNPSISNVIAFDDWLLNSDRNLGNVLKGQGSLLLIDHGRIFAYPNWTPGGVGSMPWPCRNQLKALIDQFIPHWSELLPNKSARALAYNTFAVEFRSKGVTAARAVLSEFCEQVEIDAIIDLVMDRLNPDQHNKAAGLLL